jgi:HipA-like protein
LDYDGKVWTFCYSNEFKQSNKLSTISDFPDASKIYENNSLWPFFAARIPALNQPYQLKKIERLKIDKKDSIELLKLFGKRTIANPFLLIAV